jgi:hypothetical protein
MIYYNTARGVLQWDYVRSRPRRGMYTHQLTERAPALYRLPRVRQSVRIELLAVTDRGTPVTNPGPGPTQRLPSTCLT